MLPIVHIKPPCILVFHLDLLQTQQTPSLIQSNHTLLCSYKTTSINNNDFQRREQHLHGQRYGALGRRPEVPEDRTCRMFAHFQDNRHIDMHTTHTLTLTTGRLPEICCLFWFQERQFGQSLLAHSAEEARQDGGWRKRWYVPLVVQAFYPCYMTGS